MNGSPPRWDKVAVRLFQRTFLDGDLAVDALTLALRNLGPVRLAVMGAVALGMLGFFIFLATRLASPSMVLLYGNLDSGDSSQIVGQLEGMGVPYELKSTIHIAKVS